MIIVKIYGGLAGQMMQYAFATFLESEKKEEVKIDISFFSEQSRNNSFRKFELLNWNTKFSIATEDDYQSIFSEVGLLDKLKFRLFKKRVEKNTYFREKKPFCYDPEVLSNDNRIYDGYWVNNKYMSAVEQTLKKEFTPRYPISEVNQNILNRIKSCNSVSIHFRRGDYVNSVHDVLKKDYYTEAISYIEKNTSNPVFFVFSDDIEFIKNNYSLPDTTVFIDHNKNEESFWDIYLMSNCRHNVIANSGFSFWGAWLNANEGKRVVAPSNWMETENKIEENLLLPNWHII